VIGVQSGFNDVRRELVNPDDYGAKMKWRKIRKWFAIVNVVLLVVFFSVAWWVGGSLVSPARRSVGVPLVGLPVESITLTSESGTKLAAWFIPSEAATATVILLHPIRGNRRTMLGRANLLREAGYSLFLVDFQAHGESAGDQITAGYRERHDVTASVKFVRSRNPDHRIAIVGWSLGGAAALLATPLDIDALVLESVYPTVSQAVHNRISKRFGPLHHVFAPALLMQFKPRLGISPSQLRPIDYVADVGCPVLIVGGDCDRHTTLDETKRLYDAAQYPKKLVVFNGAAHTDLLKHDRLKYQADVAGFLEAHLRPAHVESQPGK